MGKVGAILLAAGQGRRLGHDKSITAIAGQPVLAHGLRALLATSRVERVVVTVRADVLEQASEWIQKNCGTEAPRVKVILGGAERQDSVWEGLGELGEEVEWVVVQDAARVLCTSSLVEKVWQGALATGAAAAASKMSDTVRETDAEGKIIKIVKREGLWRMETPQVVKVSVLREGLQRARAQKVTVTDCLAAAELVGVVGHLVESDEPNLKITVPGDWALAEEWLQRRKKS